MFGNVCFVKVLGIVVALTSFTEFYVDSQPPAPGSPRIVNMSDPHMFFTVDEVVDTFNRDRGYSFAIPRMSLDKVLNGTIQVVDGEEYRLVFTIGDSVCSNDVGHAKATTEQCPLQTSKVQRRKQCICQAVYRGWEYPIVNVNFYDCDDLPPYIPPSGQQIKVNLSDPLVNLTADAAVDEINRDVGYSDKIPRLSLYIVESGTVQVVDGALFRLLFSVANSECQNTEDHASATTEQCPIPPRVMPSKLCDAQIVFQDWKSPQCRVLSYECHDLPPPPVPPGGQMPINKSDPGVIASVNAAIDVINGDRGYSDTLPRESLGSIEEGTLQIVDGNLYRLKFGIANSICNNSIVNAHATSEQCPIPHFPIVLQDCESTVLYKHWETPMCKVITYICEEGKSYSEKAHRSLSTEVQDAANFAVNEINREQGYSCCTYKYVVASVESSSFLSKNTNNATQHYYDMTVKIGESFCTNNELNKDRTAKDCPLQPGLMLRTCHMSVDLMATSDVGFRLREHSCGFGTQSPVIG